ncbi:leucine-rich repeat domain-containing protein, partial [Flavobacterium sp.]|uniref:DUF7619 domain-containing protein n=1 Tax=Flavobacterium sp. TaxID=239 RepID=UPI0026076EB2
MKKIYLLFFLSFINFFQAQIVNIPDANFKAQLLEANSTNGIASYQTPNEFGLVISYNNIDSNGDGEIQVSEASLIKYLNVSEASISNLEGILSFTNLQVLYCGYNQLSSLNVSGLTNLQRLECVFNQLSSLNVSDLINLQRLYCGYNQLSNVNVSGLINLQYLDFSSNQFSSLNVSGLTNLQYLHCYDNQLTSLNVSGLTNLQHLYCYDNQLPSLNVSGLTNLQHLYCYDNQLPSLNVSGLTNLQHLYCFNNQLPSLNVSGLTNLQHLYCNDNQLPSLNVSGLTNLQKLTCGSNQLTSLNVSGLTNLQILNCAFNQLSNVNLSGLTNLQILNCTGNQLPSLDLSGLTNLEGLICENNQLSYLNIKNGYSSWGILLFQNNPNLTYICADEEDITFVQSKINEYGYSTTCQVNSYCSFTPGGTYYTIQGNNKFDGNSNGCDVLDGFYPNLKFSITDGTNSGTLISNTSGNYSIPVSVGTHTFTPQFENPSYFTVSPTSATVTFPATASPFIQNFCIVPNGIHHDLEVVIIPLIPARPGFDAIYKIKYKNKGNYNETATLVFNFDEAVLDYISSTLAPTTTSSGFLSWNIGTISPFQSGEFALTLNVNTPMETPAVNGGDILSYSAIINGLNADETPTDNTFSLRQTVVNSFDPNDKTCLEGTTINPTMIGEYVHYQICFENTGTYPAENVVVKDMIDTTKFDISTLQITDTSHSCVTRITNPSKVEFIFENINLPFDDATNDGYVVFKIKTKPTLTVGSTISNLANIYFD